MRVLVNGGDGRMGREVVRAIETASDLWLVGKTTREDNLGAEIAKTNAEVVIDFTHPSSAFQNALTILDHGANAVVGTTGITEAQKERIHAFALSRDLGALVAPNFCVGAILMMKLAVQAAKHFPHIEIVEYHHDGKAEAPSGTAIRTAEYILAEAGEARPPAVTSEERLSMPSRGAMVGDIRIHAVRLPGCVASQEIIFGSEGETLRIRHDAIDRRSFLPGVLLAVRKISRFKGMIDGLENMLEGQGLAQLEYPR